MTPATKKLLSAGVAAFLVGGATVVSTVLITGQVLVWRVLLAMFIGGGIQRFVGWYLEKKVETERPTTPA